MLAEKLKGGRDLETEFEVSVEVINIISVVSAILSFGIILMIVIAEWHLLKKAGEKGWKALIPFYNLFVTHPLIGMSHIWFITDIILWSTDLLLTYIVDTPELFSYSVTLVALGFTIISAVIYISKLGIAFGKTNGFMVGIFFLPFIYLPIMAFDRSVYDRKAVERQRVKPVENNAVKIRRLESNLITIGGGLVAFSLWNLLKFFLYSLAFKNALMPIMEDVIGMVSYGIVAGFFVINFVLYSYVGISARSDARGKKKRSTYIVFLFILILIHSIVIVVDYFSFFDGTSTFFSSVITLFIDGTTLFIMVELLYSCIALKKCRTAEGGSHES